MKRYAAASALTVIIVLALANGAWAQGATNFPMIGITPAQSLQLNLVALPPQPNFPPVPCVAQMGFLNSQGSPVGATDTVTLQVGESASLTLNGSTLVKTAGVRVEVQPAVQAVSVTGAPPPLFPPDPCFASVEVIDNVLGVTLVGVPGSVGIPNQTPFGALSVSPIQNVRLNVVAFPPNPCIGQLSFAGMTGGPVGNTLNVNLNPGQATFLDLPGSSLNGPVLPIVTLATLSGADVAPTACIASVEVYNALTGNTNAFFYPPVPCTPTGCVGQGATNFPMIGITPAQSLQLNLVAETPVPGFPPSPCMAQMGFLNSQGSLVGATNTVTLQAGESASLTLNGASIASTAGERVEVQPMVVPVVGTYPPSPCFASVEVIDNLLGLTLVGVPGSVGIPDQTPFGVLSVSPIQNVRLNVVAYPPNPCIGQLSFAGMTGGPVGNTLNVNLNPGQATFLDLPGRSFKGPVLPIVTLATLSGADVAPTACIASVEVYNALTGNTNVFFYPPDPCTPSGCVAP